MLTGKDANKDISLLELKMKNNSITNADVVKAITLLVKINLGIRANLVAIMDKMGVELRKPRTSRDRDKVEEIGKKDIVVRKEGKTDEKK